MSVSLFEADFLIGVKKKLGFFLVCWTHVCEVDWKPGGGGGGRGCTASGIQSIVQSGIFAVRRSLTQSVDLHSTPT